jgi:hypothetical protein
MLALLGCSGTSSRRTPEHVQASPVTRTVVDAVARKDLGAVRSALRAPLRYGGLLFSDPQCSREFSAARVLEEGELDAFARCLVELPLQVGARSHSLASAAILEYSGIEVEMRYVARYEHAWLTFIGFVDRGDTSVALPTVSPQALFAGAPAGDRRDGLSAVDRDALQRALRTGGLGHESAWLEVCVDTGGIVTSARSLASSSPVAADIFSRQASTRRVRPFGFAGTAVPVCAIERFVYPDEGAAGPALLPVIGDPGEEPLSVVPRALQRVRGDPAIAPDGGVGRGKATGSFKLCLDPAGNVASVRMLASTGLPHYDAKIMRALEGWQYRPFVAGGRPVRVCSALTFIYQRR